MYVSTRVIETLAYTVYILTTSGLRQNRFFYNACRQVKVVFHLLESFHSVMPPRDAPILCVLIFLFNVLFCMCDLFMEVIHTATIEMHYSHRGRFKCVSPFDDVVVNNLFAYRYSSEKIKFIGLK